jgi:hypothetical protein
MVEARDSHPPACAASGACLCGFRGGGWWLWPGALDPWSSAGVLSNVSDSVVAVVLDLGASNARAVQLVCLKESLSGMVLE